MYTAEFSYFVVDTANHSETLNTAQSLVAERVYGQGDDFKHNMGMLRDYGIKQTKIFVLTQGYVKEKAKDKAIARASWLCDFGCGSKFGADSGVVDGSYGLRGVPLKSL